MIYDIHDTRVLHLDHGLAQEMYYIFCIDFEYTQRLE